MFSFCLINFGHIISEFYWKFLELDKSCDQKDSLDFFSNMLGIFLGNFGNFSLTGKAIKVDFLNFCPKKLGTLETSWCSKKAWHFENFILLNNNGHLINVEESFIYAKKFWAL